MLLLALLLTCYLVWLSGKLWGLSRRKARLHVARYADPSFPSDGAVDFPRVRSKL